MDNPWNPDPTPLSGGRAAARIDTGTAHPARMYDYYLGGRDNYEVDRFQAESILTDFPQLRPIAQANRAFLQRAVRHLAEAGITQFLDIGTGIPSPGNASETARAINPDARMVFVDNDPIVLTHAQARLGGLDPRGTAVIEADLRTPKAILDDPALRTVLDLARPVGLLLVSVLHFLSDRDQPHLIVKELMDALAPGSCLVLSHATADTQQDKALTAAEQYRHTSAPITLRSPAQIAGFFDGLELLEPGVVKQPWWRPGCEVSEDPELNWGYGGVGVKRSEPSEPCDPTTNARNTDER
jgi:SAM-dependent methyltransferase